MPIYQRLLRIVATVSGNIFLGPDLCRREEYLHASINYTVDVFIAIRTLKRWPAWSRFIGQYFTPELKKIPEHRAKAKQFLVPIIHQRKKAMANGAEVPDDVLQWMLNKSAKWQISDEELAEEQLNMSLAAIHTTTMATTDILSELAIRPTVVKDVRDEVKRVLKECGVEITTHALFEMKLLDSVMRESQRMNPMNQGTKSRD
jgi:cytochrome P450